MLSSATFTLFLCDFFFQAEDGIRDGHVTGVQTCALPICSIFGGFVRMNPGIQEDGSDAFAEQRYDENHWDLRVLFAQIGRASCRERVESSVVGASLKKKREEAVGRTGGQCRA